MRSSCASCYAHARERRDLVAAHRLYRTALFWMADLTKIQGRCVCRPFAPECSSITKIEWLQRSPRVPPQLRFSNLRLGEETANAPLVYLPTYTSGWPQDIAIELGLDWVPLNQDDPAAQHMFWSSQRASQPRTNANSIDGGSNIVHRPLYRQGMPSCTLFHYTVYSH